MSIPPTVTSSPAHPLREALPILRRDRVFWLAIALIAASLVPYAIPILGEATFYDWRWLYADIPVSVATLLAVFWGVWRLPSETERRFWYLLSAALGVALFVECANGLLPNSMFTPTVEVTLYSGYLAYYLALLLGAAAAAGKLASDGVWRLERLRTIGFGVLAMTFIVYFEALPYVARPDAAEWWYPGLFLYAALDALVALALFRTAKLHSDRRWIGILVGLGVISILHTVTDATEALLILERFIGPDVAPAWDLIWYVPEVLLVVVARRYLGDPRASARPRPNRSHRSDRGAIVFVLLALPALHVLMYATDAPNPELRDARDILVGIFLIVMGTLTVRYFRLLEEERARGQRALELSEERYRTFVRLGADVVYRAEAIAPIPITTSADEQVEALLATFRVAGMESSSGVEQTPEAPIGDSVAKVLPPEANREFLRRWVECDYRGEVDSTDSRGVEEGHSFRYTLTGIVEDEMLCRVWLTRSDITEIKRATLENERLVEELEHARKLESLGTLAGGIAHDFNNLLSPILGYSELAREAIGKDDDDARASVSHVNSAARRASDLVDQILAVSRQQPRTTIPLLVQDTAREVAALVRPGLAGRIRLDLNVDDACPTIRGDPSRVHQVLMNLCTNAGQAIGDTAGQITVSVQYDPERELDRSPFGWVRIEVDDDGPGVDPHVARRAFEPFFTTKPVGRGTGLGLSVVHGIVLSHGGDVRLGDSPQGGTRVTVRFPVADPDAEHPVVWEPRSEVDSVHSILVVDDEPAVASVTARMLTAAGHTVATVRDPADALESIERTNGSLDVLVTDFSMPGMTGVDLLRRVRSMRPDLGVVLMSGYEPNDTVVLPGCVVLRKPFSRAQLYGAIAAAVSVSKAGAG